MKPRLALLVFTAALARGEIVTNTEDSGPGSLRQRIYDQLRYNTGTITFAPELSGQTITLNSQIRIEGYLFFPITGIVTIDARNLPGGITIDGGPGGNRIFTVPSSANLTLQNLTLTGGNASDGFSPPSGGAIANYGQLSLADCTLTGNSQCAVYIVEGNVTMTHCTIAGNSGGALANGWMGFVTLTHCTLSGNGAYGGGSLYNGFRYPSLTVNNCIIAGDSLDVMNNGYFTRQGANIIPTFQNQGQSEYPAHHSGPPALTGAPLLAPLGNYGGPTRTMALLSGSPARDAPKAAPPAATSAATPSSASRTSEHMKRARLAITTRGCTRTSRRPPVRRSEGRCSTSTATARLTVRNSIMRPILAAGRVSSLPGRSLKALTCASSSIRLRREVTIFSRTARWSRRPGPTPPVSR